MVAAIATALVAGTIAVAWAAMTVAMSIMATVVALIVVVAVAGALSTFAAVCVVDLSEAVGYILHCAIDRRYTGRALLVGDHRISDVANLLNCAALKFATLYTEIFEPAAEYASIREVAVQSCRQQFAGEAAIGTLIGIVCDALGHLLATRTLSEEVAYRCSAIKVAVVLASTNLNTVGLIYLTKVLLEAAAVNANL
jgi:hypothetical protein